mgnify:CR=1 FL=1
MSKQSYKLKPTHKDYIFRLIESGEKSNKTIVKKLQDEYGISVSAPYISQLRQTKNIYNTNFFTKSMQSKMNKKKTKIHYNMLNAASDIVKRLNEWLKKNGDNIQNYSPKEISMVMGQFHKFLKSYQEMMGTPRTETTTVTAVREWDKRFELMSKRNE